MNSNIISVRRRQLMIAGSAAAATPATLLAAPCGGSAAAFDTPEIVGLTVSRGDKVIVSGRVVDAASSAVRGATIETCHDGARATSDADGRFMIVATPPRSGLSQPVEVRVSYAARDTRTAYAPWHTQSA